MKEGPTDWGNINCHSVSVSLRLDSFVITMNIIEKGNILTTSSN